MTSPHPMIRTRLSIMMLLEFFIWACWAAPLSGYANKILKLTGPQIGWLYATSAVAAMISPPLVGYVADRFFATERVLGALHLAGGVCLFLAAGQTTFGGLFTLLLINAVCYMPTLALTNSLAFRNIRNANNFSRIAVWGTVGWIFSGLTVDFLLGGTTNGVFYLASAGAIAMAAYCLTLPHTPPSGAAGRDVLGLGALRLLREPSFMVFALCAFLISIPVTFYSTWCNAFLVETGSRRPTALMTLSQFSEIVVMMIMPWFIAQLGLKKVLVIGMAAWAVRYMCFATLSFPLVILGLLCHGFCYCFVYIAAFIYVDRKAPPSLSASAQSLVAFLMWGIGMFVGAHLSGLVAGMYPAATTAAASLAPMHDWPAIWLWPASLAAITCLIFLLGGRDAAIPENVDTKVGQAVPDMCG